VCDNDRSASRRSQLELAAFREGLSALGLTYDQLTACLGGACYDVYLNDRACWRCVPARVWTYTIGGYQVMKKWLSYRERALLGRDLKTDEARYVTEMTRRNAAIVPLEPARDANYERVSRGRPSASGCAVATSALRRRIIHPTTTAIRTSPKRSLCMNCSTPA